MSLPRCFLFFVSSSIGVSAAEPILKIAGPDTAFAATSDVFTALNHTKLARAGAPLGDRLRGPALQLFVMVHCRDGYAVSFTLPDFDEAFGGRRILLADAEDGHPLPANAAPPRLIVPGDKKAARWARQVASIEIVDPRMKPFSASKPWYPDVNYTTPSRSSRPRLAGLRLRAGRLAFRSTDFGRGAVAAARR